MHQHSGSESDRATRRGDRWSAPIPSWVFAVSTSNPVIVLVACLWSKADAPSKRKNGHVFIRPRWRISNADLARNLGREVRSIERVFAKAVAEGLVRRGECEIDLVTGLPAAADTDPGNTIREVGIWLADVAAKGKFAAPKRPTGSSVSTSPPTDKIVGGVPTGSSVAHRQDRRGGTDKIVGRNNDARSIPDHSRSIQIANRPAKPGSESPAQPVRRGPVNQRNLFEDEPGQNGRVDPVDQVLQHMQTSVAMVRERLNMKPGGPKALGANMRKQIRARIREQADGDEQAGVLACCRAIDVVAHDCLRAKELSPYFNLQTICRNPENFGNAYDRWREDGNHQVWGSRPKAPTPHAGFRTEADDDLLDSLEQRRR